MTEETIIASAGSGSNIPPHPEGQYGARCIDVVDAGFMEMTWQGRTSKKHRIYIRLYCGETFKDDEGKERPLWVDKWFTLSLNEKSKLRPFLEAWRGQKFTDAELKGFNVAKLVGVPAFVQISQNPTATRTYANIEAIMRLPKTTPAPEAPSTYIRVKDRPKDDPAGGMNGGPHDGYDDPEDPTDYSDDGRGGLPF